jgi:hypothetical protein
MALHKDIGPFEAVPGLAIQLVIQWMITWISFESLEVIASCPSFACELLTVLHYFNGLMMISQIHHFVVQKRRNAFYQTSFTVL